MTLGLDASTPTARALVTLEVLQAQPGVTADRIAQRLGVSERAARRYVGMLRDAGIPVESVRGPYGGYRLGRGVRLPPLRFGADEALGLVMAVLDGHHGTTGEDPVATALGKLLAALPEPVARQAEAVRRAASTAPDRGARRPDPARAAALVEACAARRRARITYRSGTSSGSGREWSTTVDPWAVVVRHGRWYLLCRCDHAQAVRAYRVDRVREVEVLAEPSDVPAGLDPVAALEEHLASGWSHVVEVAVAAPPEQVRRFVGPALGRVDDDGAGGSVLRGSTDNPVWYAEQLAAVPLPLRVVGGPELRHCVGELGRRLTAAAQEPAQDPSPEAG